MKKINLVKHKGMSLAEIFQSLDIKFAYVNKDFVEVSAPAKCRDFLGDCVYSRKTKQPVSIYGFKYEYSVTPYDDCRFSLKFPDESSRSNFIANLSYLHEKEKQAGVKLSKIYETQEKNTLVIEGSNHWISSVWKVSFYTFYLKVMSYKTPSDVQSPEDEYIGYLTPTIESTMLGAVKKLRKEVLPTDTDVAHNHMGFLSVLKGKSYVAVYNHNLIFGKA